MKTSITVPTDSTNCKSGSIPQTIRWLYTLFLKQGAFVASYDMEELVRHECDLGYYLHYNVNIKSFNSTMKLLIIPELGIMEGQMTHERNYHRIYELGSSDPVTIFTRW